MGERSGEKRKVIDVSSSSSDEDDEGEESDDDYDGTSIVDISSSTSDSDGDEYEDEKAFSSSGSGSQEDNDDDEDDINKNGDDSGCEKVLRLLQEGGELQKLSLADCKAYLRWNGLRLSGTKEECIGRVIEHWRIKDGIGSRLYPRSSFTINCTGDACKGDVVVFTQKVYKKSGGLLGKRTIAGRIVKESYGASSQQHTFTVEVLWSKGVKQLPSLFPLLVKGRNLYKMRTFRQSWTNEEKRLEVLAEKHRRGSAARLIKATRKAKYITKPSKASSRNKGSKPQNLDHQRRPSEMTQASRKKKRRCSNDERGKAAVGSKRSKDNHRKPQSKRSKHHHQKPPPLGTLNLAQSRNSRAHTGHPNFVPVVRETTFQSHHPPPNNFRHFQSDFYNQRPHSYSSNWASAPRSHFSSYSSYALHVPAHQQYGHGNYHSVSHPRYVSHSSSPLPFPGVVNAYRSSGSFPFVNDEHRWNF